MSAPAAVAPIPHWQQATFCGVDSNQVFPDVQEDDPNIITYEQESRWVTVAVWENDSDQYAHSIADINKTMHTPYCLLGPKATSALEGKEQEYIDEWRVYPLDFGADIAAFRSVQWRFNSPKNAPPAPIAGEDMLIYSTARVYGIVNGRFVRVAISRNTPEIPSDDELRALWDAQVAKIRYHDAITRNHDVQNSRYDKVPNRQSGISDTPSSQ
ncbi:MAG: hypothetical protein Q4C87_12905 [Actinomycetaceae bacterium]|nr:hypothetical protein [Actinomycetaceae bacterium]